MKKWIFLILLVCACMGQQSQFTITDITFCASEPSDRAYITQPDSLYTQGDIVWIYLEAFKFDYTKTNSKYKAIFAVDLTVYTEQGKEIRSGTQHMEFPSKEEPVYVWFKLWINSTELSKGIYTVELTITDTISKKSAVSEGTFYIE